MLNLPTFSVLQIPGQEPSGFEQVVGQVSLGVGVAFGFGVMTVTTGVSPVSTGVGATEGATPAIGSGSWSAWSW